MEKSPNFWLITHAIHEFFLKHGELPLPGALPDMKAQSADYVKLQNIYKAKARKDIAEISETIRLIEKRLNRKAVEDREIEAFCKGAAFVKLIHGRPIRIASKNSGRSMDSYLHQWNDRAKYMCQELQSEESLMPIYIAFLSYDWAIEQLAIAGGEDTDESQKEYEDSTSDYHQELLEYVRTLASSDLDGSATLVQLDEAAKELFRARGAELHNISALTGGMVAQEVIKVITKQYIPIDNVCVFDGVSSKTAVFRI